MFVCLFDLSVGTEESYMVHIHKRVVTERVPTTGTPLRGWPPGRHVSYIMNTRESHT